MKIKQENYNKGKIGEERARKYLENRGFVWIESNFETDTGEIDLIMSDNDWLVFVEVKYKSDNKLGLPEEMIDKRKLAQVKRVAEFYLLSQSKMKTIFKRFRIDAVCILGEKINYYRNLY